MPIFLSYSRKDEAVVKVLAQGLEAAHWEVWFDHDLGGGDAWWDRILDHIRTCSVFVLGLSEASLASKPCRAELDYARALQRPILPVLVAPLENIRSSPVADLQTIAFRPEDVLSGFEVAAAVDANARLAPALPAVLPPPPPIPFAYLLGLGRQIESSELDPAAQMEAVDQLRRALREEGDESVRREILAMLRNLASRPWSTRRTEIEVRALILAVTEHPSLREEQDRAPLQPAPEPDARRAEDHLGPRLDPGTPPSEAAAPAATPAAETAPEDPRQAFTRRLLARQAGEPGVAPQADAADPDRSAAPVPLWPGVSQPLAPPVEPSPAPSADPTTAASIEAEPAAGDRSAQSPAQTGAAPTGPTRPGPVQPGPAGRAAVALRGRRRVWLVVGLVLAVLVLLALLGSL